MPKFCKPTAFRHKKSKPSDPRSNPLEEPMEHHSAGPSHSLGLGTNSNSAETSAMATPPAAPETLPGPSQTVQPVPLPTRPRPLPLFTNRPPPRERHTTFKAVKIHTAKCDICNIHNKSILNRCVDCGWQICSPCLADRNGDGNHTGGGAWVSAAPINVAPIGVNAASGVPGPAAAANPPAARIDPTSNTRGPTSTAQSPSSNSQVQVQVPTSNGRGPVSTVHVNRTPVNRGPVNVTSIQVGHAFNTPTIHTPNTTPMQGEPANRVVDTVENDRKQKNQMAKGKGKQQEEILESSSEEEGVAGPSSIEDYGKRTLRPRQAANYYTDAVIPEDVDMGEGPAVDSDSDESNGGDIPFETFPSRLNARPFTYRGQHAAQVLTRTANQISGAQPRPQTNAGVEDQRIVDRLLHAAAEALVDLGVERIGSENRDEGSTTATSSMGGPIPGLSLLSERQIHTQPETTPTTTSVNGRKRKAPSPRNRPAKTRGYVRRSSPSNSEVHTTPILGEASTSRTEPEANMELDENQAILALEREQNEIDTTTTENITTRVQVSPRLNNLYRDSLMARNLDGRLTRLHRGVPEA